MVTAWDKRRSQSLDGNSRPDGHHQALDWLSLVLTCVSRSQFFLSLHCLLPRRKKGKKKANERKSERGSTRLVGPQGLVLPLAIISASFSFLSFSFKRTKKRKMRFCSSRMTGQDQRDGWHQHSFFLLNASWCSITSVIIQKKRKRNVIDANKIQRSFLFSYHFLSSWLPIKGLKPRQSRINKRESGRKERTKAGSLSRLKREKEVDEASLERDN